MAKKKGEVRKEKKKEGQIQTIALREKQNSVNVCQRQN